MIYDIISQVIGAVAYILFAISFFKKDKKEILYMQIIAHIFFSIHYYLLSGITGSICNIVILIALIAIYLCDKYKWDFRVKTTIAMSFIMILLFISIMNFQNIYSIFPIVASVIIIVSFLNSDERIIRILGAFSAFCWLIYAIAYGAYAAIIFEALTFLNVIASLFKTRKKRVS